MSEYRRPDSYVGSIEVVCNGAKHPGKTIYIDQVLRDGVNRWAPTSESGLDRGGRPRKPGAPRGTVVHYRYTPLKPGTFERDNPDDTTTFYCTHPRCSRQLSMRSKDFQARFDTLEAESKAVLDIAVNEN
jgi:hypothetical protein